MEVELHTQLKEYGLDEREIKIYLFLVSNKELTAYRIAKEIKIHRSTCYDLLNKLIKKGFISKIEKNNNFIYDANDVSRIISDLKVKETLLLNLAPKLEKLESGEETKIKYFEGIEGQNQFNLKLFNLVKNKQIKYCYILGNTYAATSGSNLLIEKLIGELKKQRQIPEYRGIWSTKYKREPLIKKYNLIGQNKFLDIPSFIGTVIYGQGVALLYTTDNSYTVDISNSKIAKEFKVYFEHLWKIAKE